MLSEINIVILVCFVIIAAYFDLKERKIPNKITFPAMIWGIVFLTVISGLKGLQTGIVGCLFGFAVFFIPFAMGFMGGGDVKMMAAIGSMLGWHQSALVVVYTAITGGIIVIVMAIYKKQLKRIVLATVGLILNPILKKIYIMTSNNKILSLQNKLSTHKFERKKEYIPYGLALAIGTLLTISGVIPEIF